MMRVRGLWILPVLGALAPLILVAVNGGPAFTCFDSLIDCEPDGDPFLLLDAALNGLIWYGIAILVDRLIGRFRRPRNRSVADQASPFADSFDCSDCGKEVSEEARFCPHCGASFQDPPCVNPDCENIPSEGERFCSACGWPVQNSSTPQGGGRRQEPQV